MKARILQGVMCECGAMLDMEQEAGEAWVLACNNPSCKHCGHSFAPPEFEIDERE